ncbi:MAG: MBL fold metallo-hydrolase [Clostridiales Family XIII bacterium]|jgi:metallo-beta-lactamase family protein|nr:MBL fold metallo-hydrolase [Clostridiales Family XIII bacterium]
MKIKFCGAAESVTGSCHLVTASSENAGDANVQFLLDCGQFQGSSRQEAQNLEPFPFDPAKVDYLILSHAHIDHCGRIPLLVKRGFTGKIYCTDATADLLGIMLRDSAHIHEQETEWANRKAARAGRPLVEPLYTQADAEESLKFVNPILYDQQISPSEGIKLVFNEAGHILGSAIVELWITENGEEKKLVFSGDLGASNRPLLRDPTVIKKADYVIMESTYGNRLHKESEASIKDLANIIETTTERGGSVIIPSFAVGRTQDLIYELNEYYEHGEKGTTPNTQIKVFIDSPMATAATEVFKNNIANFDEATKSMILAGDDPLDFVNLRFTKTTDDSKALNADRTPKVIISASGMCEAGRIRHHLKHHLWDPKASIVFVGYQAEGTLGRKIIEGAKTVMLFGEEIYVNAQIHNLQGFSAHADKDGLIGWARGFEVKPKEYFLVHGEYQAKKDLAGFISEACGFEPTVIEQIGEFDLTDLDWVKNEDAKKTSGEEAAVTAVKPKASIDEEDKSKLLDKIKGINDNLENVLYEAKLAAAGAADDGDEEKVAAIRNIILNLEKDTIKLATELAETDKED